MKLPVIKIFASFFILLCGFTSCKQDELETVVETASVEESEIPVEEYTGEVLDVNYAISIPQYANVLDAEESVSSRSLKEDSQGKVHFDYANMSDVVIHLCLQNGEDATTRSFKTVSAKIVADGAKFQVKIPDPYVQLKKGELEGDTWKVCAIMESTERTESQRIFAQNKYVSNINTNKYFSIDGNIVKSNLHALTTPLYSSYVAIRKEGGKIYLDLNFKPLGTILRMKVQNTLAEPIYIHKVKIKNPSIKSGNAKVTLGEEVNGIIKFDFAVSSRSGGRAITERGLWLPNEVCSWDINPVPVGTDMASIYLWCIPVSSSSNVSQVEFIYGSSSTGDYNQRDSVLLAPSKRNMALQSGYYYNINAALPESDLMITELLHLNPSWWYNYSVVEVYNPTNRTIDIRNYGLCRMLSWDYENPLYVGETNSYPKPLSDALVQDLYIADFNQTVYKGSGTSANSNYQRKNRYYDMYGTHVNKGEARYMLKPGNTVVLAAGQLRWELANRRGYSQWYWPTGSLMYNIPYLANAVKMGFCQYAAAVDNGMVESQYANERYMSTAGVLQHGSRHVLVLVKRKQPGAPYEPVDWLFSACTPAIVKQLQTQALPDFSGNTNADWVFVSRKDGVMYPIAKRDNETFLHATKSHLPQNEAILYTGHTYQFYDWIYRFGEEPRNYRSQVLYNMTPGTRFYNRAVDNNGVWLPGSYNELGEMDKPNPTTGK